MSIEQKLLAKLQPHADRIRAGNGNDFDYLPAVLLQVVEGQRQQAQAVADASTTVARKLDETEVSISSIKTTTERVGAQSLRQMDLAVASTNERLEVISKNLSEAVHQFADDMVKAKERLVTIEASIVALTVTSRKEHHTSHRLLIVSLVSTAILICLGVLFLLRH